MRWRGLALDCYRRCGPPAWCSIFCVCLNASHVFAQLKRATRSGSTTAALWTSSGCQSKESTSASALTCFAFARRASVDIGGDVDSIAAGSSHTSASGHCLVPAAPSRVCRPCAWALWGQQLVWALERQRACETLSSGPSISKWTWTPLRTEALVFAGRAGRR